MVSIIAFMYRYLGVLAAESSRMSRARAARSAVAPDGRRGGSIAWRAKVTGGLVGALFLRSYERSERIYAAMQARGFEGEIRHIHSRALRASEYLAIAIVIAACAAYVAAVNVLQVLR
jgi:cobalt/nickel transport system permease protein